MNRDFVYNHNQNRHGPFVRTANTLNRWLWGAFCCGVPGVPCYFCNCCERLEDGTPDPTDLPRVNQSTATVERVARPHRPNALRGRKHTPETLSAVRCALSKLESEKGPIPPTPTYVPEIKEPG